MLISDVHALHRPCIIFFVFGENPPSGVPPKLPFVYFLAGRARATLRGSQPGHGAQGLPAVANLDALQGVPRVYPPERSEDDERAAQGFEGEMHRAVIAPCFFSSASEGTGRAGEGGGGG